MARQLSPDVAHLRASSNPATAHAVRNVRAAPRTGRQFTDYPDLAVATPGSAGPFLPKRTAPASGRGSVGKGERQTFLRRPVPRERKPRRAEIPNGRRHRHGPAHRTVGNVDVVVQRLGDQHVPADRAVEFVHRQRRPEGARRLVFWLSQHAERLVGRHLWRVQHLRRQFHLKTVETRIRRTDLMDSCQHPIAVHRLLVHRIQGHGLRIHPVAGRESQRGSVEFNRAAVGSAQGNLNRRAMRRRRVQRHRIARDTAILRKTQRRLVQGQAGRRRRVIVRHAQEGLKPRPALHAPAKAALARRAEYAVACQRSAQPLVRTVPVISVRHRRECHRRHLYSVVSKG